MTIKKTHISVSLLKQAEKMNNVYRKAYFGEKRLKVASDYIFLLSNHTTIKAYSSCFECGSIDGVEQHHVLPRSYGGKATIPLCYVCHSKAHGNNNMRRRNNHSELIKNGLETAKKKGKVLGRPTGTTEAATVLEKYPAVVKYLKNNFSIRKTAKLADVSPATVQKVKRQLSVIIGQLNKSTL